jgi:phage I-like protein
MQPSSPTGTRIAFGGGHPINWEAQQQDPANPTPNEIEVILSGDYKTRDLLIGDVELDQIIANHKRASVDPAVDFEHESWAPFGNNSPAKGWVKSLRKGPSKRLPGRNALIATIEWTDLGEEAIKRKHFRYISAGLNMAAEDRLSAEGIGVMLDHVALVKHPFVQGMEPLSFSANQPNPPKEKSNMKTVFEALGLSAEASEAVALSAIGVLNSASKELLALTGTKDISEALGAVKAFKAAHDVHEALSAQVADYEAKDLEREFNAAIEAGKKSGKLTAHMAAEWAGKELRACGRDGLKQLASFLVHAPQVVKVEEHREPAPADAVVGLSAGDIEYCKRYGISPEDMAASKARRV